MMRSMIGRLAAVLASAMVVSVLGVLGVEVTEEDRSNMTAFLTEALTGLGMLVFMLLYPIFHKLINRRINPADDARPHA